MASNKKGFRIVFRGVRGSHPVADQSSLRYGGNTTCHEIRVGGHLILLDAGTGIIPIGNELLKAAMQEKKTVQASLFFSHVHHDHTFGFLYFKPVYIPGTELAIFGPKTFAGDIKKELLALTAAPFHPMSIPEMGMDCDFHDLQGGESFVLRPGQRVPEAIDDATATAEDDVIIRVAANPRHTKVGVLNYRVEYHGKSYVFATDVEGTEDGDPVLDVFAKDADLMAYDGQYTEDEYYKGPPPKKGWGHSTLKMAVATAKKAGVKSLAIVHHDPEHDDEFLDKMDAEVKELYPNGYLAKENQVIEL